MTDTEQKRNNGLKAFGGVIAVAALMTGIIGAIIAPMKQRINYNAQALRDHALLGGHSSMVGRMAAMQERFTEIETQFGNLNERTERMDTTERERIEVIDQLLQTEIKNASAMQQMQIDYLWERIHILEAKP